MSLLHRAWFLLLFGFAFCQAALLFARPISQIDPPPLNEEIVRFSAEVNEELAAYERLMDRWRLDGTAYKSVRIYEGVDDLELLIRDVRGDVLQLEARTEMDWALVRNRIEQKMVEVRKEVTDLTLLSQGLAPPALAE